MISSFLGRLASIHKARYRALPAVLFLAFLGLCFPSHSKASSSLDEIKATAVVMVEQLFELFPTTESNSLERDGQTIRIEVTGIKNSLTNMTISDDLNNAIVNRDAETLVEIFIEHYLQVDMENSSDHILVFKSMKSDTPESRLYQALYENRNKDARAIIENESPDLESLHEEGFTSVTPLGVATRSNNMEMVKLLLEHGADPNNQPEGMLIHPMGFAVVNGYLEMSLLLLDAGVQPDLRVGALDRDPLTIWAVRLDSMELMEALIEKGADPTMRGVHGWTALGDAIVQGNARMIDYLAERSNPLSMTQSQRRVSVSYNPDLMRAPDYPYFPASNTLFLSRIFGDSGVENLEQRLLQRAEVLGGEAGSAIVELRASNSLSNLTYAQQDHLAAMTALEDALSSVDISTLNATASSDYVSLVMSMLADLHELKLVNGQEFKGITRELSDRITELGGWRASVHDMLDVLQQAVDGDATESFAAWQSTHSVSSLGKWNFRRINDWIETHSEAEVVQRLHSIVDFYELPRFAVK